MESSIRNTIKQVVNWMNVKYPYKTYMGKKINGIPNFVFRMKLSATRQGISTEEWKGFITPQKRLERKSVKYANWRKSVFERDNHTCQSCRRSRCYIEAHHLKSFAKYNLSDMRLVMGLPFA